MPRWLGASKAANTKLCSAGEASGKASSSRTYKVHHLPFGTHVNMSPLNN